MPELNLKQCTITTYAQDPTILSSYPYFNLWNVFFPWDSKLFCRYAPRIFHWCKEGRRVNLTLLRYLILKTTRMLQKSCH